MAHVLLIGALPESLTNFRGDLIRALVSAGHRVTAMAAPTSTEQVQAIESLGASFRPFQVHRNGLNPWRDVQTLLALRTAFRQLKPDVVLAYTIKPIVWGGYALSGIDGVRFFAMIEGAGYAFQPGGFKRRILTRLATLLYRTALRKAVHVMFLNKDNESSFLQMGIVKRSQSVIVNGTGIDLERFAAEPFAAGAVVFLTITRLLGEKGLREYAHAARLVKQRYPDAVFRLLGPADPSPDGVPLQEVQGWHSEGVVEYLGAAKDVRPFIADCHVYVLPSYHEGMPRTVLEAMSMGRPILTTDVAGCRETVLPGENGYLVPKANAEALAERMIWFIEHRDHWQRMGQASRHMAEERFDVHRVNAEMLRIMDLDAKDARA
jgi:glycosyltransferase involved in cell wall biosynthesis